MTEAETTVLEIIKWAVSPMRPAPEVEALDEDLLVEMVVHHRIEARLLARLEAVRPAWCPPRLLTRLRIRQHTIRRQATVQMAAAREMSDAMRERGLQVPIFVKGFAAYALTANPESLHFSGDLDPFAEDLPAFWDVLHSLGYSGKRKETHEWAKLSRGGVTLDIHQHFPVLAYPSEVRALPAARLDVWQNPGHWSLPAPSAELVHSATPLLWEDLVPEATIGTAAGTKGILFPSPTLLCLIHCAHCFRSSITRLHYMDPRSGFRLYEIICIFELLRLPNFDPEQFMALVDRFAAHDCVHSVNTLAAFLGCPPLPEPGRAAMDTLPEQLIYGGWVVRRETEDWLWPRGITEMIEQLGATAAPSSCRLDTQTVVRLLTQGANPPAFQIAVHWNAAQKSVTLDWIISEAAAEHELLVHFGYGSVIKIRLDSTGGVVSVVQKSDYGQMDAQAAAEAVSGSIRLTCAVPTWPGASAAPDTYLPLFLAVRRLSEAGDSTEAATYLPLQLSH